MAAPGEETTERRHRTSWLAPMVSLGLFALTFSSVIRLSGPSSSHISLRTSASYLRHGSHRLDEEEQTARRPIPKDSVEPSSSGTFESDSESFRTEVQQSEEWWYNLTHRTDNNDRSVFYLNSTEAYKLLMENVKFSQDFIMMQQGWDVQWNQAYCAVAASAAVLNSLRDWVDNLPIDDTYDPYPYATQDNMFNECTEPNVIHRTDAYDGIFEEPYGLGMDQTKEMLSCHLSENEWLVEAHHLDPDVIPIEDMRRDLLEALLSPTSRVLVNFDRHKAHQEGGGHWSPLGGYLYETDAFLIMDVAKYKYPPSFIPATVLYQALSTKDSCGSWDFPSAQDALFLDENQHKQATKMQKILGCSATYRGYIIVKQK